MTHHRPPPQDIEALIEEFERIRADMRRIVDDSEDLLSDVHPQHRASAENLLHYLALRSRDLRPLQERLAARGLSSLGRAESHVLRTVETVLDVLKRLAGRRVLEDEPINGIDMAEGQRLLGANTQRVLGPQSDGEVAIMVTMPSEAANDYALVRDLREAGMDVVRINCAHDTAAQWARMIEHVRRVDERRGKRCRILMDLAGPKVRTGPMHSGPEVVKFRPTRDRRGLVVEPARVWLYAEERPRSAPAQASGSLPIAAAALGRLAPGDRIRFVDARHSARLLRVLTVDPDGCWAESRKTCYMETGTTLTIEGAGGGEPFDVRVGTLPSLDESLTLAVGDELIVTHADVPGRAAIADDHGRVLLPATIGCTADQIFADVRSGDRILFDDGKIGGVVMRQDPDRLRVRITQARTRGGRLGAEKGINLPDTVLRLPALTAKDKEDLQFVTRNADMVALSFVNSADDVRALRTLLEPLQESQPAIVLKIETRRGFENLPAMLLEALKAPRCAVMIARGDLAVECGFERMAEVQEEILWLCEAAHVPVIWATQVLESLAKDGLPSRAEVTDAAMAHRAECVMLNKGPYIVQAVKVLDDILKRMRGHQAKKRSMLRELHLVSSFRQARAANRVAEEEG